MNISEQETYFLILSYSITKSYPMLILIFFIGLATWTLTEYLLHRYLGHVHKGKNFFKAEHLQHHSKANYFAPAYKKALLALVVSGALLLFVSIFTSLIPAAAFVLGFLAMYCIYEMMHFRFHSKEPIAAPFIILRKHHFYHHFHNPKMNLGLTTRFWDRMFGTFKRVEQVNVPKQMSMKWLLQNDEIKDVYANHFKLSNR
jgi:sterol desaturase/sphingolipid hydroxylase (fatty acid hydroxylase superfamily)